MRRLANDDNRLFFRTTIARPVSTKVKRYIRVVDTSSGLIFFFQLWFGSGFAPKETRYLHRWNVKSVLRRAGVRK